MQKKNYGTEYGFQTRGGHPQKAASSGNYRRGRRGKCRDKCGGVFHAAVMTPYKKRLHAKLLN